MARYTGPVCRLCRRAGGKLELKGDKCASAKCAWEKRGTGPGIAAGSRRRPKVSERGLQLRQKQRVRDVYGVLERQMRNYYAEAKRVPGVTGETLLQLLERRLDNAVFRLGFGETRRQTRQMVNHGHISVNGRRVDIPSFLVKPGDVVTWMENSKKTDLYNKATAGASTAIVPSWLTLDIENMKGQVLTLPTRADVDPTLDEKAVVAYYSR